MGSEFENPRSSPQMISSLPSDPPVHTWHHLQYVIGMKTVSQVDTVDIAQSQIKKMSTFSNWCYQQELKVLNDSLRSDMTYMAESISLIVRGLVVVVTSPPAHHRHSLDNFPALTLLNQLHSLGHGLKMSGKFPYVYEYTI